MNQVLYANSNTVISECFKIFEKIGVMDFQGVGALIKVKQDLEMCEESKKDGISPAISNDMPFEVDNFKLKRLASKKLTGLDGKHCPLDLEVMELCSKATRFNRIQVEMRNFFHQLERQPKFSPSMKQVQQKQRHSLGFQLTLAYQDFLT